MNDIPELNRMTARAAVAGLRDGSLRPRDLIEAAVQRHAAVDPLVNALPTLCEARARERAGGLKPEGEAALLAGLPIAIKDLMDVAGVRTTYGSPIFADHVPDASHPLVERLERRGAIVLAKSNTPELGAGGNTFNKVFGKTRNPWNTELTCGGSSGGAAVALATGQIWLAHGSDHGGSLRLPATYCSVVGLRPSPGLVPRGTPATAFNPLSVEGPMARNVPDLALLLDAMAGFFPGDPLSVAPPAQPFLAAVEAPRAPLRVAYSPDLGATPVEAETRAITAAAARRFAEIGVEVVEACPDFSGVIETFQTLRAVHFVTARAPLLERHGDRVNEAVTWNVKKGLALDAAEIGRAERERAALYARVAAFFADHDLLLCPAAPAPAFPVDMPFLDEVDGVKYDNYIEHATITFAITLTGCPALSLPCGFSADGRPVGLQMVGRPRGEAALLQAAALLEQVLGLDTLLPIDPWRAEAGQGGAPCQPN